MFPSHRFVRSGRHATLSCCLKHYNACGSRTNKSYARVPPAVHAAPSPKRTLWEHGLRHSVTGVQAEPLDYDASSSQVLLSETGVHHRGPSAPNRAPCNHPCVRSYACGLCEDPLGPPSGIRMSRMLVKNLSCGAPRNPCNPKSQASLA